jgi:hypothetical protein
MIMSKSRLPFTGYSRLLERRNGTFKGFAEVYEPGGTIDWSKELATPQVPAGTTSTGVPYYLADPGSSAGGETVYVTPTPTESRDAGSSSVGSFFTSLFTGFLKRAGTPSVGPQIQYYQQAPKSVGPPGWVIGAGIAGGAALLYVLFKK